MTEQADERPGKEEERPSAPAARGGFLARGPLAWMANNHVASNLLMALLFAGGLLMLPSVKQEVFPEFDLDLITVVVPYPGASPEEVEQGVVLAVEEAVRGLDGVKEVRASAMEGAGLVTIELLLNTEADRALSDVKSAVDRITSIPADAERPVVSLVSLKRQVLSLMIYGDASEKTLRELAERTRHGLLERDEITNVEIYSQRPIEISVEVPQHNLRRYGLTLEQVADAVRVASVELPGGGVKTRGGEVLVRVAERRQLGPEFESIVVLSRPDGTEVLLRDVAVIKDGFAETDQSMSFNGKPAVALDVYRIGDQGPVSVANAVQEFVEDNKERLPAGVSYAVWNDRSEMFAQRVDLLRRNSIMGLILVIVVLGLLLEMRLAFWVTMGIPASFVGSLIFLPVVDVSINMISLFAFIVTLGMVVDDAIIVGEAVYKQHRDGLPWPAAAVAGVREVAGPVTFSILTTVIAFMPLLFVPGTSGKFFRNIPWVVISVLLISLVEGLFVLPAHLGAKRHTLTSLLAAPFLALDNVTKGFFGVSVVGGILAGQRWVSRLLERFVDRIYVPFLEVVIRNRYLALATALAALALTLGLVAGGRVQFTFFPKIDGDVIDARLEMPVGTPVAVTEAHQQHLLRTAQELLQEYGGEDVVRGVMAEIGGPGMMTSAASVPGQTGAGGHVADVMVFLVPSDERTFSSSEFARKWRQRVGEIAGAESLGFNFATGHGSDAAINVRLSHPDPEVLEQAAERLAAIVRGYSGTYDVKDGTARGKAQLDFTLRPEARSLGLSQISLARQVRSAFYGAEAVRQQRGRNELRVYVRRPLAERASEADIENLMLLTPDGGEVPLLQAADVTRNRAYTTIKRAAGRRTIDVTAEVDEAVANASNIMAELRDKELPKLQTELPNLTFSLEGQGRERQEIMGSLGKGFVAAVLAMFALLSIAFRSYVQPVIVLSAIPFGMIGAVIGHMLMGYTISLMTMFGVVALSGVVVNDSLVLVDAVNRYRREMSTHDAVVAGGQRRFRPILLTSLTTFLGLTPMILETSMQARFLIPMAISLGFGVLFATFIILLVVPCSYMVLEDVDRLRVRFLSLWSDRKPGDGSTAESGAGAA